MAEFLIVILTGLVGLRLSVIDLAEHRLPDRLTLPLAIFIMFFAIWGTYEQRVGALVGASTTTLAMVMMALLPGNPLGWGDVKFQWSLGWTLGMVNPAAACWGLVGTFALGGAQALIVLVTQRGMTENRIALGPWMVVSTLIVLLLDALTEVGN